MAAGALHTVFVASARYLAVLTALAGISTSGAQEILPGGRYYAVGDNEAAEIEAEAKALGRAELERFNAYEQERKGASAFYAFKAPMPKDAGGVYAKAYRRFEGVEVRDIQRSNSILYPLVFTFAFPYKLWTTPWRHSDFKDSERLSKLDTSFKLYVEAELVRTYRCTPEGKVQGGLTPPPIDDLLAPGVFPGDPAAGPDGRLPIRRYEIRAPYDPPFNATEPNVRLGAVALPGYVETGRLDRAMEVLEAAEGFWSRAWERSEAQRRLLSEWGTELGLAHLERGEYALALRAFSAAGRASDEMADYLYRLREQLTPEQRDALWPDGAFLTIEDFEGPYPKHFELWHRGGRKELLINRVEEESALEGKRSLFVEVSSGEGEGAPWYSIPVHIAVSQKPFGLRLTVREEAPGETKAALGYHYKADRRFENEVFESFTPVEAGAKRFDIEAPFLEGRKDYAQKRGYNAERCEIRRIGIVAGGPANSYRIDAIELYIP